MAAASAAPEPVSEEQRLRSALQANPSDFESHTSLLSIVEQAGDAAKLRQELNNFLKEYPLCYGFWKKLADAEAGSEGEDAARAAYERGVKAFPNGVELWTHYCSHVASHEEDLEVIRGLFKRAAEAVGSDANSEKFWDKYLEFEVSQTEWPLVLALYQQLLAVPTRVLDKYWDGFKQHTTNHPTTLPQDEAAKKGFLDKCEQVYKLSAAQRDARATFEGQIKRSYFHVRPLDQPQLQNWRDYLDFELGQQDYSDAAVDATPAVRLHERTLVACSNYPEFWIRFIKFLNGRGDKEAARSVAQRAVGVHLKHNPEMHAYAAEVQEIEGNIEAARKIHQNIVSVVAPGLIEGVLNLVNFERRQGEHEAVAHAYEAAISSGGNMAFLSMHYARYLAACRSDLEKCRAVYKAATDKSPELRLLWEAWLVCEAAQPQGQPRVQAIMAAAVGHSTKLELQERQELWQWYLEYLADFGSSLPKLRENQQAFAVQFPSGTTKKRSLEDQQSSQPAKQARVEDPAALYQAQMQQYQAQQQQQWAQQQWAAPQAAAAGYAAYQ